MSLASSALVVEDDPVLLEFTCMELADGGFEVARASGLAQAMAILERGPAPAFVVTDIGLEGERTGLELARTIAERWPEVRLIIISGEQRPPKEDYPNGALFVTKPCAQGALLTLMAAPAW